MANLQNFKVVLYKLVYRESEIAKIFTKIERL
jgi:hypothetical protein